MDVDDAIVRTEKTLRSLGDGSERPPLPGYGISHRRFSNIIPLKMHERNDDDGQPVAKTRLDVGDVTVDFVDDALEVLERSANHQHPIIDAEGRCVSEGGIAVMRGHGVIVAD